MANRRIAVTGLGIVSPLGIGKQDFWKNLLSGVSGIRDITLFRAPSYQIQRGGEIKNFIPEKSDEFGRAAQFAITATKEALREAGIQASDLKRIRAGVIFGTTNGESHILEEIDRIWLESGETEVWAKTIIKYSMDSIANNVARHLGISGISRMIPTACSAGNYSIGHGYDLIRNNKIDVAIVGGADPLTRYAFAGFGRLFAMAPEKCQPFDKNRKGMMIGEGAGVLVLEELESAKKRGADIYCEIVGYGLSCDAYHMTAPSMEGITGVMETAIKNCGIEKSDVSYISAHGTGTPANDKAECQAINRVFGVLTKNIPISSIKSMLGHTMGAASAIEAASCCMAIKGNRVPPTINFDTPDPECDIDCVPNIAKDKILNTVLNNSFAFGGNNACVVMRRYEPN